MTEVLKILPEAVGRGQHFQDRGGGGGTYEQQFIYSIYIFTDKLFLFKPELPVVCWGVSGVLYSFLLQEPTEVK